MTAEGPRTSPPRWRSSRAESEDLLDGAGSGPLHELLEAASGPAHREEVVGEGAAVTAFLSGHRAAVLYGSDAGQMPAAGAVSAPDAPRRPRPGRWRTPTGLASALALALATAGVAAGAATLVLRDQPPAVSAPAPPAVGAGAVGSRPLPDAVRVTACGAWRAAGPTTSRTADPAFVDLIVAAGGTGNVDGFCAAPASPTSEPPPTASTERTDPASSTPRAIPSVSRGGGGPGADTGGPRNPAGSDGRVSDNGGQPGNNNGNGNGNDGGNASDGHAVGPPAVPPGQAERNGPASGRAVGPPTVQQLFRIQSARDPQCSSDRMR